MATSIKIYLESEMEYKREFIYNRPLRYKTLFTVTYAAVDPGKYVFAMHPYYADDRFETALYGIDIFPPSERAEIIRKFIAEQKAEEKKKKSQGNDSSE